MNEYRALRHRPALRVSPITAHAGPLVQPVRRTTANCSHARSPHPPYDLKRPTRHRDRSAHRNLKSTGQARDAALLANQAQATIIDLSNKNKIMASHGDKFNTLPMFDVDASDEALFANVDWIKANEESVNIFVSALLSVYRDMANDPTIIRRETNPDGPIGELPDEVLAELDGFYTDAVAGGLYDINGGGAKAAMADMEWYSKAGQLEGDMSSLKIEDFWYLKPLDSN